MLSGSKIFGNETVPDASWHSAPLTRGTFSILSSCLITLFLCVWSAIHLNICPEGTKNPTWLKIGWTIMAVLAPELVAFTAWQQLRNARGIDKLASSSSKVLFPPKIEGWFWRKCRSFWRKCRSFWRKCRSFWRKTPHLRQKIPPKVDAESSQEGVDSTRQRRNNAWTTVHSFYVVMGGFVIDSEATGRKVTYTEPPSRRIHHTLTPYGIKFLLEWFPDVIPDIGVAEIEDKSKGDALTKAIVCIQAAWFCAQCISRLAGDLTVSLLELNTLGHCVCMFFIYWMWWDKPLNIRQPTIIRSADGFDFFALFLHCNPGENPDEKFNTPYDSFFLSIDPARVAEYLKLPLEEFTEDKHIFEVTPEAEYVRFESMRELYSSGEAARQHHQQFMQSRFGDDQRAAATNLRWHLASKTAMKLGLLSDLGESTDIYHISRKLDWWALVERNKNWPTSIGGVWDTSSTSIRIGICIAGLIYGGLHLLAWNAPFPSSTQRLLWRISAATLAASGPAWICVEGSRFVEDIAPPNAQFKHKSAWGKISYMWLVISVSVGILYVFSRVYLVVECFITLPYLPQTALMVQSWSQYFVHFS